MTEPNQTWDAFPYAFNPSKTMTTKELTELMRYLFAIKPVSKQFFDGLPPNIQQHFTLRDNPSEQPTFLQEKK